MGLPELFHLVAICLSFQLSLASEVYEAYRKMYGRGEEDVTMYEQRRQLFEKRQAEVLAHNSLNRSWNITVNHFSDFTDLELRSMLGYKRVGGRWAGDQSSFLEFDEHEDVKHEIDTSKLASAVDWRHTMKSASQAWVKDQGACGSCWAAAATTALEMQYERQLGVAKQLSHRHFVDCTPNPGHCGGTGGCHGATGELAYEYARNFGVVSEYAYSKGQFKCNVADPSSVRLSSFVRLPENSAKHLLHAVATKGPVVVSVEASGLYSYKNGVYAGCQKDATVEHAMVAVGYGHDLGKDYWLLQNSWTPKWGEEGRMRMERHMTPNSWCGTDYDPLKGVGCPGGPTELRVCGMCGIESDSIYPNLPRANLRSAATSDGSNVLGAISKHLGFVGSF
mmetsp:Transcript_82895/g.130664  ORF Transcript_82895/g.130664 Transcript_82895/m.130664 type:complete len:393 (-) Transcript_82895:146-1324(-)